MSDGVLTEIFVGQSEQPFSLSGDRLDGLEKAIMYGRPFKIFNENGALQCLINPAHIKFARLSTPWQDVPL